MVGRFDKLTKQEASGEKFTRIDLVVMSLISLVFGLAVIAKGLLSGG